MAQWQRTRLQIQETRVPSLVWEDPTCRGATKPMCHRLSLHSRAQEPKCYSLHTLELKLHSKRSHRESLHAAAREQPPLCATQESLHGSNKDQLSQKTNIYIFRKEELPRKEILKKEFSSLFKIKAGRTMTHQTLIFKWLSLGHSVVPNPLQHHRLHRARLPILHHGQVNLKQTLKQTSPGLCSNSQPLMPSIVQGCFPLGSPNS